MTHGATIWLDQLSSGERRPLDPGTPTALMRRPDVLVVGGGIQGVATASACQESGLGSVLVIESSRVGAGATGGAAGLLIPEAHQGSDPAALVELGRSSLGLWQRLEGLGGAARDANRRWRMSGVRLLTRFPDYPEPIARVSETLCL